MMKKLQAVSSKLQRSTRHQVQKYGLGICLELWIRSFSRARGLGFGGFARACLLPALALILSIFSSPAQTNTAATGNRFLFVVETSRSMQNRSEGTLRAIQQLLNSGMGGQLRRGDTLGIWTYNQELYAGRFRLQLWSPETHKSTVANVVNFLQHQTYEKKGSLE